MKYYLHDSNAFNDEKITELYIKFGYEGLGLFYTALEKFAAQEKPIKTSVLKSQLYIKKRLEKCWSFMEEIGIISSLNGDSFNKELLNFSEKYQIRKEKTAKRVAEWRLKHQEVTRYEHVTNAAKVKLSKVKLSKVNKETNKESFLYLTDPLFVSTFEDYLKGRKKTVTDCARNLLLIDLHKYDKETAIAMLEQSIKQGWIGLFPLKNKENNNVPTKNRSSSEYDGIEENVKL